MDIGFLPIDIKKHFNLCVDFRRDAFFCSFNTYDGYEESVKDYKEKMIRRETEKGWYYFHIWKGNEIIGQLEFRSFSGLPNTGYVHLIYILPSYRGSGIADIAENYIAKHLKSKRCKQAILSVSRNNERAIRHYKRHKWSYLKPNPKHQITDLYIRQLCL